MVHLVAFLPLFTSALVETYRKKKKPGVKRTCNFSLKQDNHTSVRNIKQQHGALLGIHHKKKMRAVQNTGFPL